MKLRKLTACSAAAILAATSFSVPGKINAESVRADIDPLVYDAVSVFKAEWDENSDGVISDDEFSHVRHLTLANVTDETDLGCLKKAESLRSLSISSSTRTDYSDLADIPSLRSLSFSFVPVSDLSFTDKLNLNYLILNETEVSREEKIKHVRFPDVEIPAGYYDMFSLSPACALGCEFEIADGNIAGFENDAESKSKEMYYNHIYAKSVGETEYSVILDGEVIAKRKIKVVPAEVYNPPLEKSGPEVVKTCKSGWTDDITYNTDFNILLSDGRVFKYQKGNYTLIAENAADISSIEHFSGGVINMVTGEKTEAKRTFDCFVLFKDGRLTLNGEEVFDESIRVRSVCGSYVITEDDELWYIDKTADGISPVRVDTGYSYLYDYALAVKKDKTVVRLKQSANDEGKTRISVIKAGQYSIKSIIKSYNYYILDTNGNFWCIDYQTGKSSLLSKNTAEAGFPEVNGRLDDDVIYITKDGKAYSTRNKKETTVPENHIMHDEYDYNYNAYSDVIADFSHHGFPVNVTVNGITNEGDDRFVAESVSDSDGTVYFSCFGDHMAVTEVSEIIGEYFDGEDALIHFLRTDGTLWEYNISKREFRKTDFPEYSISPSEKYSAADLVNAVKYFFGDETIKMPDYNGDGVINITDIIFLKNMLTEV